MLLKDLFPLNSNSNLQVSSIEIDSRLVKSGSVFFALQGHNTNGAKFIDDAITKGAIAVITSRKLSAKENKSKNGGEDSPLFRGDSGCASDSEHRARGVHKIIQVDDVYETLVLALQKFYHNLPKNILAVTGTNGKTSVAYFIMQLQEMLGLKSASIGTLGIIHRLTNDLRLTTNDLRLTTPDIVSLYKNLYILKQNGINDVAIETSSIGLDQKRLAGLKIGLGAFTNFTQDHLDYHGVMEKYFDCKMLLFKEVLQPNDIAVLNADIPEFEKIKKAALIRGLRVFEYSAKQAVTPSKDRIQNLYTKMDYSLRKNDNLSADFQKANLLCALTSVIAYYKPNEKQTQFLFDNLDKIKPADGRMQLAATLENNARIFIDYAHTPDALQNVLTTAKKLPHNRLLVLFGCGGNRDKDKRPLMGKIANNLADLVIVTDDNPRCENPVEIRKEILSTCDLSKTIEINNRKEAIIQTIKMLKENDILILAGKGHEKYQIIGEEKFEFDEEKIINDIINII